MNTRDLIELSQLDALGLLDEQERDEFDAAFAGAGPAIRAQIRSEQSRLVKTDWVACEAEPPEGLREAVLGEMSLTLRVADLRPRILDAIHDEIARRPVPQSGGALVHGPGRTLPRIYPVRRVSPLWRAAALGFASAAVAFAGVTLYLKGQFDQLGSQRQRTADWGGLGANLGLPDVHFNQQLRQVYFTAHSDTTKGEATLYIKPGAPSRVVVWRLPERKDRDYRIVLLDEEGKIGRELARFASGGSIQGIELDVPSDPAMRLAIVDAPLGGSAEDGDLLLVSGRLG